MDVLALVCLIGLLLVSSEGTVYDEEYLDEHISGPYELMATDLCHKKSISNWNHATDLLNATKEKIMVAAELKAAKFYKDEWQEYFRDADWKHFRNPTMRRQMKLLSVLGIAALDTQTLKKLDQHSSSMSDIYSTAKICPYRKQKCKLPREGLSQEPGIQNIMTKSKNYDELAYTWKAWRDASGAKERADYKIYVKLMNQAARANGFHDMGAMWRYDFESDNFVSDIEKLWQQVEPLYVSLHSYVHKKLYTIYGDRMGRDGLIPAHLLGNMWGQSWVNLFDLVVPYPNVRQLDITRAMKDKRYTVRRMFETANEFYMSLGLPSNAMSYNESLGAMITKPVGKEVVCHPSAWDFCNGKDYRIKMCTEVNDDYFVVVHHEMGHIAYDQLYSHQPHTFRGSANPGFTEAIGDTIALSVTTPKHMERIGLFKHYVDNPRTSVNALMKMALLKVAFLPFGLLVDKWRWDVFSGAVDENHWNSHWWQLRKKFQRLKAPVPRSERDFDPGAKYHIPNSSQYISYFVSHILQFQLHKSLCIVAGEYNPNDPKSTPLHKCDIFRSKEAGKVLKDGLSLGLSRHWSEVLFILTGQRKLDGSALLEYFAPLSEFLQKQS